MSVTLSQESLIELSQLRWHCRRGVKELDVVLGNYLEKYYLNSTSDHQKAFKDLLKMEDPLLMSLVLDNNTTDNELHNQVLDKVKNPYN